MNSYVFVFVCVLALFVSFTRDIQEKTSSLGCALRILLEKPAPWCEVE